MYIKFGVHILTPYTLNHPFLDHFSTHPVDGMPGPDIPGIRSPGWFDLHMPHFGIWSGGFGAWGCGVNAGAFVHAFDPKYDLKWGRYRARDPLK